MTGRRLAVYFRFFGFEIGIDWSWLIIAVLVVWSLSIGYFPFRYSGLAWQTYLLMGIAGAAGLFLSIIFHEFCHSLAARHFGIPIKRITLFIFGGMAELHDEPPSPKAEFMMAAAGPLSSLAAGALFYAARSFGLLEDWSPPVIIVLGYLAFINWLLAGFNLIPAFPLDGGRILRSGLWAWKRDLRAATRSASSGGKAFGLVMMLLGGAQFLFGNFIGGMWWFLIGMFLRGAAAMSYQQLLVRKALEGEHIGRFMKRDPVTVQPSVTVQRLVEDYVYRHHYKMFPVVEDGGRLVGCISTREIKSVPRDDWPKRTVGEIAASCSADNTMDSGMDAVKALTIMNKTGTSRLLVTDKERLVGILSLKDLLKFFSLKVELED